MKFLKKINSDSKAIIQDLRDLNDSLINAVGEYQLIIFELKETIENQKEEIEKLQETILKGGFTSYVAVKAKDEWHRGNIEHINRLKAEIERLKIRNDELNALNKTASIEAIREFVERFKQRISFFIPIANVEEKQGVYKCLDKLDEVKKEMVGDE